MEVNPDMVVVNPQADGLNQFHQAGLQVKLKLRNDLNQIYDLIL